MDYKLSKGSWKRHFSVPCYLFDKYIGVADGNFIKVILCFYAIDDELLNAATISKTAGLTYEQTELALEYWEKQGVIIRQRNEEPVAITDKKTVNIANHKINLSEYSQTHAQFKQLVVEAELTLGRTLTEYEKETLVILTDYYGYTAPSVILILEHCSKAEHVSAKYIESIAANMHDKGIITYEQLEEEFLRLTDYYTYESQIKRALGISIKLTKKQSNYINSWKSKGFSADMISLAGERCADSTNKISFPYIDKVLANWESKGIFTPEAAEEESATPTSDKKERSFDLSEYDDFSLGDYIKK